MLDTALDVFDARGYHGASVRDLAKAMGVTEGAIYHYFPGKRELFAAVVRRALSRRDRLLAAANGVDAGDLAAALTQIGRLVLWLLTRGDAAKLLRIVVRESPDLPDVDGVPLYQQLAVGLRRAADLMAAQQQAGHLRKDLDPHLLVRTFAGGLVASAIAQRIVGMEQVLPLDPNLFAAQHAEVFLHGAAADSGGRPTRRKGAPR
jgi:AcrR family transcriptional regulator